MDEATIIKKNWAGYQIEQLIKYFFPDLFSPHTIML